MFDTFELSLNRKDFYFTIEVIKNFWRAVYFKICSHISIVFEVNIS